MDDLVNSGYPAVQPKRQPLRLDILPLEPLHLLADPYHMEPESCFRHLHAGQILQLAARFLAAVGTGVVRVEALRTGCDALALRTQQAVLLLSENSPKAPK